MRTIAQTVGAFAVEFAVNYQDALYRIRNSTPDIILCDYMLGEGRSGQHLLEELRRFRLLADETVFMMVTGEQSYKQVISAVERAILEAGEFPWSCAGVARSLEHQDRLTEARAEIDRVVACTPHNFDAADVKARICMAQGEPEKAQKVLDEVANKTRRNYLRKRLLAEAATLNGDTATAQAAMADVLANDTMPGAIQPEDKPALARSQVNSGDKISTERTLVGMRESEVQNLKLDGQASFAALMTIAAPERGKLKFVGLRPALISATLDNSARLDVTCAALGLGDHELADHQAHYLMASDDAKKIFGSARKLYALHGRKKDFREIQKQVARRRIHHD